MSQIAYCNYRIDHSAIVTLQGQEMSTEQEKVKSIYIGYHPRSHDGSSPKSRSLDESIPLMENFNEKQEAERFRAEVVEVAFTDLYAVAVMDASLGKVWQYL